MINIAVFASSFASLREKDASEKSEVLLMLF